MTRNFGDLTPPRSGCGKCEKIKKQAEDAFSELRKQTDVHIDAVQKQLSDEYGSVIESLKSQYESLFSELAKARDSQAKQLAEKDEKYNELMEEFHKYTTKNESEETNAKRISELQIQLQTVKSQLQKTKADSDRQVEQIMTERDDAILEVNRLNSRMSSIDNIRHEYELEKAKMDLAYRKRIGEMESEVRRTEIESVRLRKQILSLTQQIDAYEHVRRPAAQFGGGGAKQLIDDLRRSRFFAIESTSSTVPMSGRITRLTFTAPHDDNIETPATTPAVVELSSQSILN